MGRLPASRSEDRLASVVRLLEQAIAGLGDMQVRLSELATPSAPGDEPSVRWLEDDELAGRLQRILRHQARRHGIDLS